MNATTLEITAEDQIINYHIVSVLILCFPILTVLNPPLLYHHYHSDRKGVNTLLFSFIREVKEHFKRTTSFDCPGLNMGEDSVNS